MTMVQTALRNALVELLQEQAFEQLQVKQLSRRAGVARATFYLHFQSKEALLLDYVDTVFEEFLASIDDALSTMKLDQHSAQLMFQALAGQKALCRVHSFVALNYAIDFWAGGSLMLIRRWVEQDFTPCEATMAELYSTLTLQAFRELVH